MVLPARTAVASLPRPHPVELARLLPSTRSLLVGLGIVAAAAAAYALARETPLFAVQRIAVRGTDPHVRIEVRRALRDLRGTSLVALSAADLERRVAALPDVASISYDRAFPHTLRVVVVPERPVAVLRRGAAAWLVSGRGRVLRGVRRGTLRRLPRVWTAQGTEPSPGDAIDGRAGVAIAALAHLRRTPLGAGVRGATFDGRHGLVFVLRSGLQVRLGSPAELDLKLAIARRIVALAPPQTLLIDVSVPERPVSSQSQVEG